MALVAWRNHAHFNSFGAAFANMQSQCVAMLSHANGHPLDCRNPGYQLELFLAQGASVGEGFATKKELAKGRCHGMAYKSYGSA